MSVKGSNETVEDSINTRQHLLSEKNRGLFLYDVLDIKKEASTPLESEMTVR